MRARRVSIASRGLCVVAGCGGGAASRHARTRAARAAGHADRRAPRRPRCAATLKVRRVGTVDAPRRDRALRARAARGPGVLWTHNDSGDSAARVRARPPRAPAARGRGQRRGGGRLGGHRDPRQHALRRRHRRQRGAARRTSRSTGSPSRRPGVTSVAAERIDAALPRRRRTTPRRCSSIRARHDRDRHQGLLRRLRRLHRAASGTLRKRRDAQARPRPAVTAGDVSADGRTIVLRSYDRAFVWTRKRRRVARHAR